MSGYPHPLPDAGHVEPVARRIRATLGGRTIVDTTRALFLWESPKYPFYYLPLADFAPGGLVDEDHERKGRWGTARRHGLHAGDAERPGVGQAYGDDAHPGLAGHVRIDWDAVDAWYEEDEQVFVHPRSPYVRVDALRSSRSVRVELDGVVVAESASPVVVFETGLPPRWYLARTAVHLERLAASTSETACPYKGVTSDYWASPTTGRDVAWSYDFPTTALTPIAGLVAFFDERVDMYVDGKLQERPQTPFS